MRFKLDENLPVDVADILRQQGHDAATVDEQGMQGASDIELAEAIKVESRWLITLDLDFSDLRAYPPAEYPGIVVLRLKRQDRDHIIAIIKRLLIVLGNAPQANSLWIVDETTVRVRR